jgi:IS5 family transposase
LLLFKINLLGIWYGLSDEQLELNVNDRLSFSRFVGLPLDQVCPDHSTIWRFRERMQQAGAWDKLLDSINEQLAEHKVLIKEGVNVDASITNSPNTPKGPLKIEVAEDRAEDTRSEQAKEQEEVYMKEVAFTQPCADPEARWLKKGNKSFYGYKKHVCTTTQGLVLAIHTTPANESDTKNLKNVVDKCTLPKQCKVHTDKGYSSKGNRDYLKSKKLKDRIQHKAVRGTPLNNRQKLVNRLISQKRYTIERTFGSIKKWFKSHECRYRGLARTHTQHILEAICYNLKVSPGIVMSNAIK